MKAKTSIALIMMLLLSAASLFAQNTGTIEGTVTVEESGEVLPGVNVILVGTTKGAATTPNGQYEITSIEPGEYRVKATYLGFAPYESSPVVVEAGETLTMDITLTETVRKGNEIVVSGSRQPEKLLESPATIETVTESELATAGGSSYLSAAANLKGVNFQNAGVNTQLISARGFNSSFNTRMLFLVDGRIATLGGTGLPQGNFLPSSKIDIKNIEVVLGPAAALYGPNAGSGVVNVTTKDPWDQSGINVSTRLGNQDLRDVTYRVAGTVNNNFGYKVTGQYLTAQDFKPDREDGLHFYQTQGTQPGPANNVFETDVTEDYDVGATKVNGSLYYRLGAVKFTGTYGYSSTSQFSLTSNGRNRIDDWKVNYQTFKVSSTNWYAQFTRTGNEAGSYQLNQVVPLVNAQVNAGTPLDQVDIASIRESVAFVDDTEIYDSEIQYNNTFSGVNLVAGFNYRNFLPESEGTYLEDGQGQDISRELYGGYAQLGYDIVEDRLNITAAARVDGNTDYDTQFSPKASLVYTVAPGHNLRATYNRAFTTPTILQSHAFIPIPQGDGYFLLQRGNLEGYTIRNGAGDVVNEVDPTVPEEVNSYELGYKGAIGNDLFVDVVGYLSRYQDFIGTSVVADGLQTQAFENGDPVMAPGSAATGLITFINFGEAEVQGFDVGLNYYFTDNFIVNASMSTIKLTNFDNDTNDTTLPLNAPPLKFKGGFKANNLFESDVLGAPYLRVNGRWQDAYQYVSGYWNSNVLLSDDGDLSDKEELPSKFQLDASLGFDISDTGLSLQASMSNIFDTDNVDILGTAPQGRTYFVSLQYNFNGLRQ